MSLTSSVGTTVSTYVYPGPTGFVEKEFERHKSQLKPSQSIVPTVPRQYLSSKALPHILGFLSPADLVPASCVSRQWKVQTLAQDFLPGQCLLRTPGLSFPIRLNGFGTLSANGKLSEKQEDLISKASVIRSEIWYKNDKGQVIVDGFYIGSRWQSHAETFADDRGTIVVWQNGDAVLLSDELVGRGLSKSVYKAYDLRSGAVYASACTKFPECDVDIYRLLKGKRGIAQIYNHMHGTFNECNGEYMNFVYGELYDSDLSKVLRDGAWSLEDLKVIVKDLVYAIIALEGDDPRGDWICHGDIKDANIFLRIDKTTHRVLGAYLGDFGSASKCKTREVDKETLEQEIERYGFPLFASRETQRERFISSVFHQIKNVCETGLRRKFSILSGLPHKQGQISLKDLCAGDPVSQKFMEEMENEYSHILKSRPYFHCGD